MHQNSAFYQELMDMRYPFVMIDRYCPDVHTDSIVFDDEDTAFRLTEALIRAGHERIGLLLSQESFVTAVNARSLGYRKALELYNLQYHEEWVDRNIYDILDLSPDSLHQLGSTYSEFLDKFHHQAPTAIVTVNIYAAEQANADLATIQMALMQAIIEDGAYDVDYELKIPLASISHKPLSLDLTPVVVQAVQSGESLGQEAMRLIIARISGSIADTPQTIKIPMTIQ